MMVTKLSERQLKLLVKESVREALDIELSKLRALAIPYASSREQKEIERLYKKPSRRISRRYKIRL